MKRRETVVNTPIEERRVARERDAQVTIVPAGERFPLDITASGFWFADGTSLWLGHSCNHEILFQEMRRRDDLERPERTCSTLMQLWETGTVRILVKTSDVWKVDLRGYYEPVLARFKEWFDWLGPDRARATTIILDVVERGTDVDLAYFQGNAEQAYAWLLMGCPNHNNRRPKSGGQGTCSNAKIPDEGQIRQALKVAGVPWAR